MTRHFTRSATLDRGSETYEVMVDFTVTSWGHPARTYGPAEHCDPGDPVELEIDYVLIPAPPWALGRYPYDMMRVSPTDRELETLEGDLYDSQDDWED